MIRALLLLLCLSALPGVAHAGKQEELDNLRKRIAAMQQDLEKTSESKSEAVDALRVSERAISDSNRELALLSERQREADRKLATLQAEAKRLSSNIAGQQSRLGELLYRQYLDGQQDYLRLLLNNRDPNQTARDLTYLQYIARNRAAWLASMRSDLEALDAVSNDTREQREQLAVLRAEQMAQKKTLEKEQRAKQNTLGKISQQLRKQRREIGRMQRNEQQLSRLVEKITKMLAQPKSRSLFRNDDLPDSRFDGKPFAQLKGKLTLPVTGTVTNRFGDTRPDSTMRWKGLFVRTSAGQSVKAIAAGRVVFADWLRGFGNLIIVDHGKGYMSLYGNNETLYKQVGDELRGGDTLASAGNSGGNEDYGLYFELRHESRPLDPLAWLAK